MKIVIGFIYLDFVLKIEKLTSFTKSSTSRERRDYEKWDRSNCM